MSSESSSSSNSETSTLALMTPPDSSPGSPIKIQSEYNTPFTPSSSAPISRSRSPLPAKPSSYTHSLLSLTDNVTSSIASSVYSIGGGPLISIAKFAILQMMSSQISYGKLTIVTPQGESHTFPAEGKSVEEEVEDGQKTEVTIKVLKDSFWLRLVAQGDLGFSEAYMMGECEVDDLVGVFKIFIKSSPSSSSSTNISGVQTIPSRIFSLITSLTNSRFANTITNSICNISAHYDLSNGMFSSFLSRDMTYSCAIYPELDKDMYDGTEQKRREGGVVDIYNDDGVDELEEAQLAKLRHIIKKADIRPGHRVLEIGSGWGSLAIEAVKMTNCTVDTITLSSQQKALAEDRIKAAGLAGRIRVWLMDYRKLPESWKGSFDRVVSIEMLEAVGKEFIPGYFGVLNEMLNERGAACIQVITIPESRFEKYQQEVDFIRKWIFPGGFLPTVTYTLDSATQGSKNKLVLDSISNIGPHYARTLREWRHRFIANFDNSVIPALLDEHPEMGPEDIQVFKRKWIYYFAYCEIGFSERVLGDHIFTFVREGYSEYGCSTYQ
ncbi:hypothetical protein I302_104187 [Kwoniella bestiolae CBS 10118]|uniref:Cyclopropane-fatty-acyl-phospholipid synthase n=1 Tax=Kwoniella bestiolae CBS 10118 TaxID=1296100 RepID=A0A1B9GAK9_9TREE|nr:hypothetical protein I302_02895 [Kwoniella bestiolae CBS 10118]OCF28044.1 hypothetical protein I302_02895 [Kwoniella bestiolae CBS 10118]